MFLPPSFKSLILAALLSAAFTFTPIYSLNFFFPDFQLDRDRPNLILSNTSTIFFSAIQVTPDVRGQIIGMSGRVVNNRRFGLWNKRGKNAAFNTSFVLNIKNQTNPGGEGTAFILAADSSIPANSDGQWLGILSPLNSSSQANIVAIEFDTRKSYPEDLDDNHIGLDINTIYSTTQVSLYPRNVSLSGGQDVHVNVQYDGQHLAVFVGQDLTNPVFSVPIDLSAHLPEKVYVGFSGSTSNYTELNCVRSWNFNGLDKNKRNLLWVWIVVPVGFVLLAAASFFVHWQRRYRRLDIEEAYPNIEDEINVSSRAPKRYSLRELRKATDKFSPKKQLGIGGFGTVYKGFLGNKEVAVKRISKEKTQGKREFLAEVTTIGTLHQRNLVKLVGWCYERSEFLLVYEYMPNGSLDKLIFADKNSDVIAEPLSWEKRLSVISGVAQAVEYLHNGCEKRVLHRDIKSSNVLLDSDFNAKLGDFGLARTLEQTERTHHTTKELAGTPGYMAPEFIMSSRATIGSDIYAFGVLILEVACGRRPGGQSKEEDYNSNIVNWVWELHRRGMIIEGADPRLEGKFEKEEMVCLLSLGLACSHPNPNKRPPMKTVLQVLSKEAPPPEVPLEKPPFVWPVMPPFNDMDYTLTGKELAPFSQIAGR